MYHTPIEETYITHQLEDTGRKENWQIQHENTVRQMSLFTDFHLQQP
mgnify:FL=1